MRLEDIAPRRTRNPETGKVEDEHAFIGGITGFGKSYLVKRLDAMREYTVIHDPKDEIHIPGRKRFDSLDKMMRADPRKHPKMIYAPNRKEARDERTHERFFEWIFRNGNRAVILDELSFLATSRQDMPEWLYECYARARTRGVAIWALTQEPVFIPKIAKTQTKHRYCFYVADQAHQDVMVGMLPGIAPTTKEARERIAALQKTQFFYYRLGEKATRGPYFIQEKSGDVEDVK